MATKWYFRDESRGFGPSNEQTSYTADETSSGYDTPLLLSTTKGSSQTFAVSSGVVGSEEYIYYRVFCTNPLQAQTIPAQTITVSVGCSCQSGRTVFGWGCYVWRGSTNVATICSNQLDGSVMEGADVEEGRVDTDTSSQVTLLTGDRICIEMWGYTINGSDSDIRIYFNGSTDPTDQGATADAASYIEFGTTNIIEGSGGGLIIIG
jgi:hypothetical protein